MTQNVFLPCFMWQMIFLKMWLLFEQKWKHFNAACLLLGNLQVVCNQIILQIQASEASPQGIWRPRSDANLVLSDSCHWTQPKMLSFVFTEKKGRNNWWSLKKAQLLKKMEGKSVWERDVMVFAFSFRTREVIFMSIQFKTLVESQSKTSTEPPHFQLWGTSTPHPELQPRAISFGKNSHKKKQRRNFQLSWTNCCRRCFLWSKCVDLLFCKYLNRNKRSKCEVDSLRATTTWNRRGTQPTENVKHENQTVDEYSAYHRKSWLHTQVSPCYSRRSWVQWSMIRVAKV